MAIYPSKEFPGLAFSYDPNSEIYFKVIAKDNLRKLDALPTGKKLLKAISKAAPGTLSGFQQGVNVILQPPLSRQYNAPGLGGMGAGINIKDQVAYNSWYNGQGGRLLPSMNAKVQCQGTDEQKSGKILANGQPNVGCTCYVYFNNNELLAKDGKWMIPYITLGHELIHALHFLTGTYSGDVKSEEYVTVGIKGYQAQEFTENKLRMEAGLKPRTKYFSDD